MFHAGSRSGHSFAEERADPNANVFDAAVKHIGSVRAAKRRVVVAGWTEGSLDRLAQILAEHHLGNIKRVATLAELEKLDAGQAGVAVLPLETGFETDRFAVIAEQDILGDRLVRRSKKRKKRLRFHRRGGSAVGRRHRRACRPRHRPLHRPEDHRGGRRAA